MHIRIIGGLQYAAALLATDTFANLRLEVCARRYRAVWDEITSCQDVVVC